MKIPCTGVILAGGLSSRFSGNNKAFLHVGGKRIFDHLYDTFKDVFEEILLVTNDPLKYLEWDLNIVTDIFPYRSSLTGIHAGLFFTQTPYAFFAACDAPFLKRDLIRAILEEIQPRFDVIIPETSLGLEPLCAAYSRQCLQTISAHIVQQEFKIREFFRKVRVKKIPENVLRTTDPDLLSFFNINTPDDLARAEALAREQLNQ